MTKGRMLLTAIMLHTGVTLAAAPDTRDQCATQSRELLSRLQAQVVGTLDAQQLAAANEIVLDVCRQREAQLQAEMDAEVEQAVRETRREEQEKSAGLFTDAEDKQGNSRLKRRGTH